MPAQAQIPQHIAVTVDKGGGEMVELNLSNYSIRSADFRVQSWDSTSGYVVYNLPSRQYRGYVTENPNELVVAVIDTDNTLDASVHDGSGRLWTVSGVDVSSLLGGGPPPALPTTGVPVTGVPATGSGSQALPGPHMPPADTYTAHGVYDVPSRYYLGTVEATLAQREYAWNLLDYFNMRDGKLNMQLTEVIIRKEQFYFPIAGQWSPFVSMLRTEWLAQGINRRGFIAGMFPEDYSYAGGFAVGNSFYDAGSEAVCVNSLYHESAHNWRASHFFYGVDTMSGSYPAHGEMNVMKVLAERAEEISEATPSNGVELTTNAVTLVHPYAFPDLATTLVDTSVDINVLTNDWDANGGALSIRYFTTNTVQGGSVTQSGNVLTYTPASGYVGKDIIVYQVEDDSGLYSQDTVHIEVINQGLAASWSFEDASGTTATDGSGNSHSGTLSGATFGASTISGPVGNAIALASGQYMVCDTTDLIAESEVYPIDSYASNFFDPMDESFTATCWFKLKDSGTVTLFDKDNPGWFGYILYADIAGLNARVKPWNGMAGAYTVSSGSLQQDAWYHAAMVINRSDHSLRLYLNGVEVGTAATLPSDEFIFNGREDLVMGGGAAVDLDEAQVHTKALSLAEIQALYDAGDVPAGGPQPGSGSINQSLDSTVLEWLAGNPTCQHDVYFGTDASAVAAATTASPEYQGQQSGTTFDPGTLDPATTYFWRIDEVDGGTVIPGNVWSFSTAYSELLSDLVLHLTMDNDDVQTANGIDHTADDIAAPAQDFQIIDALVGQPGQIGESIDLNSTNYTDTLRSYIVNPIQRPLTGGVTISFWINTTSTQNGGEKVYDAGGAYFMRYYNGDLQPIFDGSSSGAITFDANINDGQWHHIVAHNNGAGTTTVYVDGTSVGTQSETLYDVASLGRTMSLGATYNSTGENLDASFDDFAVWQRALEVSEIAGIHTSGLAGQSFNNEPVLVNTSFEVAEGFSGFPVGGTGSLGTVVDNDGVTWTELADTKIWNRTDIPPAGVQALVLGLDTSDASCLVQIPGTTHGVGLVTFDYAAFSSSTDADFSLLYNDNAGSGWVEVWSTHMVGLNPNYATKPWPTMEVAVNVPGDVDLKFATLGTRGAKFDNVRITGGPTAAANNPPAFTADPFSTGDGMVFAAYSDTIAGSATDADAGDTLTYTKVSGPAWLGVAADGTLSGTPGWADTGLNSFGVEVSDGNGGADSATLNITVSDSGTVLSDDFQSYDVENPTDFSEGGVPSGNWSSSDTSANATRTFDTSNFGGTRLWISNVDDTEISSAGISTGSDGDYTLSFFSACETSGSTATGTQTYDVLAGPDAASAVSLIGGPLSVDLHGDDWQTPDSKSDHMFTKDFHTGTLSAGDQLFLRFKRVSSGSWVAIDDVQLALNGFADPSDTTPPAAPAGLTALAGIGLVELDWDDNTEPDLDGYTVYRSTTSGSGYASIATGVTTSDYTDGSVANHTTYYYVVTASDTNTNESATSAEASAQPGWVSDSATSDITVSGTVSGTLADATVNDDVYQAITEVVAGNTSELEHKWVFDVTGAELVTFYVEAHHTANSEGDDFVFACSTNDVDYTDMVTVTKTADDDIAQAYALTSGLSGTVYVRVLDADRTDGNTQLDTISVDAIFIVSEESTAAPGAASAPVPADAASDVAVDAQLSWTAGLMTASHDVYFGTNPSPSFQGNQTGTTFDPGTLLTSTTYYWAVDEVNNSGSTAGPVWSFTTVAAPNLPPTFTSDPFSKANATENSAYSGSIASDASDPEADPMTFSKVSGPAWLSVASDGTLSGTPGAGDVGLNAFTVQVDATGGNDTAMLNITVDEDSVPLPGAASNPSPVHRARNVSTTPTLSWTAGSDVASHNVYFGTDSGNLIFQGNQTGTTFAPGTLSNKTTYYWRIDEVNSAGTTTGSVWQFKTVR